MLRKPLLFCLLLLLPGFAFCRGADTVKKVKPKAVLVMDTTTITQRNFDSAALKNYAHQKAFIYTSKDYVGQSAWDAFWHWVWQKIEDFFGQGRRGLIFSQFFKYFFIVLGAATLAFIIFKLAGVNVLNIFRKKPVSGDLPYSESLENIHEINFDEGIEQAVAKHNYRLAVRLMYLKCLKHLSDSGQIHWEINKTNNDYSNELADYNQRVAFNLLTRQFEYIWYGNFIIDATVYNKVSALFKDFKETMKA